MILIILLIALVLRLISINQSLWLDEAINVSVASSLDVKKLIFEYALSDFHPPLFHIILKYWIDIFGFSEISVRIPSIIFALGSIYVIYLTAKKLFEQKTALIAATLLAAAPLHIYYSQEARMYMAASFFASLSVYFFISILKKDTLIFWLGFIISTTLVLYTDYIPYLMIPTYLIYLFFNRASIPKGILRSFVPAYLLIFILILPWLVIFPKQFTTGLSTAAATPAWAQVVGGTDLKSLLLVFVKFTIGRISHDNNLIYFLLFAPAGLFTILLFLLSLFRTSRQRSFLYFWLFIPIVGGFFISFFVPIFSYFRFIFLLGAFYIIWASAINTVNWTPLVRSFLGAAMMINLISSSVYFINPKFQRENWREATKHVTLNNNSGTIILFESNYTVGPFDYYNINNAKAAGALTSFTASNPQTAQRVKYLTEGKSRIFLFQYLSGITDPTGLVFNELTKNGFVNISTKDFNGVGFVYEFQR